MTEMTPEERADDVNLIRPVDARRQIALHISAAVRAEHERTREACAKVAEDHVKLRPLEELKPNREISDVTWARRQIAAAIRAMPEQDPA